MICTFNFLPYTYTHPSWLEQVCPIPVVDEPGNRAVRLLSRLILKQLDLMDHPFWDFTERQSRYGLLPPAVLEKLSRYIGAAFCWKEVSLIIDGPSIVALKQELGNELFAFITERAPIMLPEKLCLDQKPVTAATCLEIGAAYLASMLRHGTDALHKRTGLKLPQGVWPQEQVVLPESEQRAVAMVVEKILSFEVDPAWARILKSFN